MARETLTDRTLKALKPALAGKRYDRRDSVVPGLLVRVTETGKRTFMLQTRFPGSHQPTRRAIGEYGAISLDKARQQARDWLELIRKGIDPQIQKERERLATQRHRENTFAAIVEEYLKRHVIGPKPDKPRQRKGREVERAFERVFIPLWGNRSITDVTRHDIIKLIEGVRDHGTAGALASYGIRFDGEKTPAPAQARNLLTYLKTFFSWAIERDAYGLEASACDHISPRRIIGKKLSGDRTLDDDEILAFWRATGRMGYPYGQLYRVLLLNGLRLNEAADASWTEFDLKKKTWTIPAERMKAKNDEARPHVVPITADTAAILESLPDFKKGEYLFSTTFGTKPVWVGDKIKKRLDARMLRTLRALARVRGEKPAKVKLRAWVNHDLRRTLRSRLSELRVDADVAEAILAHVKPGIRGVYDRYELLEEKSHALELWANHVKAITRSIPKDISVRTVSLEGSVPESRRATFAERAAWVSRARR
jgi:integrase